jgi:flagellar protein FliO/FliZ
MKNNQLVLGRGELKASIFALLFFGAWLFIAIQPISAQEAPPEEVSQEIIPDPRAAEREISFDENGAVMPARNTGGPSIWAAIRMLLVLILVAVAIYGVIYFLKKAAKPAAAGDPFLRILSSAHLGSNRYAHIVSVGSRAWLLGASDGGVKLISEIEDKEIIDSMLLEDSRKSSEKTGRFPDFLSILRRFGARPGQDAPNADNIRKHRERLKGE